MTEETANKAIAKFCWSKFENYIPSFVTTYFHYIEQDLFLEKDDWQRLCHIFVMLFLLIDFPQNPKLEKTHGILVSLFYVNLI